VYGRVQYRSTRKLGSTALEDAGLRPKILVSGLLFTLTDRSWLPRAMELMVKVTRPKLEAGYHQFALLLIRQKPWEEEARSEL
jgi:hypothetical protein